MTKGIVIFGPAGAGKSALGTMAAKALRFPYFDNDDFIWRKDTEIPFTERVSREEEAGQLLKAILPNEYFVLSGYMNSCDERLEKCIRLAVHINAPAQLRLQRIHRRDYEIYGDRILSGGDMYETHEAFLKTAGYYDSEGAPYLKEHLRWAESLACPVIFLDGEKPLIENLERLLKAWEQV